MEKVDTEIEIRVGLGLALDPLSLTAVNTKAREGAAQIDTRPPLQVLPRAPSLSLGDPVTEQCHLPPNLSLRPWASIPEHLGAAGWKVAETRRPHHRKGQLALSPAGPPNLQVNSACL